MTQVVNIQIIKKYAFDSKKIVKSIKINDVVGKIVNSDDLSLLVKNQIGEKIPLFDKHGFSWVETKNNQIESAGAGIGCGRDEEGSYTKHLLVNVKHLLSREDILNRELSLYDEVANLVRHEMSLRGVNELVDTTGFIQLLSPYIKDEFDEYLTFYSFIEIEGEIKVVLIDNYADNTPKSEPAPLSAFPLFKLLDCYDLLVKK